VNKKGMFVVLGIALAFSLGTPAPAAGPPGEGDGAAAWKASGPDGGSVLSIVVNPSNPSEAYAATSSDQGQVFRSTNGGSSWKRVGAFAQAISCLALDPGNPSTVYALGATRVFKSLNKGTTWTEIALGAYCYGSSGRILVSHANPNTLLVAGFRVYRTTPSWWACLAVFRSTNGGLTWNTTQFEPNTETAYMRALVQSPSDAQVLFVGGGGYRAGKWAYAVYKSVNGGLSWSKAAAPASDISGLAVHPANPNRVFYATGDGVFRSADGGATWEANSGYLYASSLAIDPLNPETLHAGSSPGCWRSTDGGISWVASSTPPAGKGLSLAVRGDRILYGSTAGLYRSTNGGVDYRAGQNGLKASYIAALAAAASSPSTMFAAATSAGLYRSANGGANWTKLPDFDLCDTLFKIVVDPTDAKKVFVLASGGIQYVLRSADGGLTWNQVLVENIISLAMAPSNPQILFAAGQIANPTATMGVFISKDGGTTWTSKRVCATPGSGAWAVAVDPRSAKVVFLGGQRNGNAALYKSANGGTSWKDVTKTMQGQVYEIAFDPNVANRVFVATGAGIYRTTNGGTSWSRVREDYSQPVIAFHPTKTNTLYAGGSLGVVVSSNGGTTWLDLNSGLAVKHIRCLAFNRSTKVLYAGTAGGGVYKIQQ
jgi:photosystem II stability/assembly factor-like uncharacterized protein